MGLTCQLVLCIVGSFIASSSTQFVNNNKQQWSYYSLHNLPKTSFTCRDKILGGYYADAETQCQMFHVCVKVAGVGVQDFRFLCPNGTAFDQEAQTCADWGDVDCEQATLYYGSDNFDLYRIGSGFESKRAPFADEEEAPFHLQRAESADIRRSKQTIVNQSTTPDKISLYNGQSQFVASNRPTYQPNKKQNYQPQKQSTVAKPITNVVNDYSNISTKKFVEPKSTTTTTTYKPYVDDTFSNNKQNIYNNDNKDVDEIFKGSHSSNFFNNRNNGKEDDFDDFKPQQLSTARPFRGRQRGRSNYNNANIIEQNNKVRSTTVQPTQFSSTSTVRPNFTTRTRNLDESIVPIYNKIPTNIPSSTEQAKKLIATQTYTSVDAFRQTNNNNFNLQQNFNVPQINYNLNKNQTLNPESKSTLTYKEFQTTNQVPVSFTTPRTQKPLQDPFKVTYNLNQQNNQQQFQHQNNQQNAQQFQQQNNQKNQQQFQQQNNQKNPQQFQQQNQQQFQHQNNPQNQQQFQHQNNQQQFQQQNNQQFQPTTLPSATIRSSSETLNIKIVPQKPTTEINNFESNDRQFFQNNNNQQNIGNVHQLNRFNSQQFNFNQQQQQQQFQTQTNRPQNIQQPTVTITQKVNENQQNVQRNNNYQPRGNYQQQNNNENIRQNSQQIRINLNNFSTTTTLPELSPQLRANFTNNFFTENQRFNTSDNKNQFQRQSTGSNENRQIKPQTQFDAVKESRTLIASYGFEPSPTTYNPRNTYKINDQHQQYSSSSPRGFSSQQSTSYQTSPIPPNNRYQTINRNSENSTPSTVKKFSTLVPSDQYNPTTFRSTSYRNPFNTVTQNDQKQFNINDRSGFNLPLTTVSPIIQSTPTKLFTTKSTSTTTTTSLPILSKDDEDDGQYRPELYEQDLYKNKLKQKSRQNQFNNNNNNNFKNNNNYNNFNNNNNNNQYNYNNKNYETSPQSTISNEEEFLDTAHSQNIAASGNELILANARKSSPKPFSKTPSPSPTPSSTHRPIKTSKKPTKKPTDDKDASYDYAYYDLGNDNQHDYSEYSISDFGRTTVRKP